MPRQKIGPVHLAKSKNAGIVTACDGQPVVVDRTTMLHASWYFPDVTCPACRECVEAEHVLAYAKGRAWRAL